VRRICHMAYFCRLGSYFWGRTSENRALCEVRRISIPRTSVNKGKKKRKDQGSQEPRSYVL
jgi:hypothetical protein